MESKTPMQELLQSAFNKSYYVDNGTSNDPQVIEMVELEEIIHSMLPNESTLIAEHRMMKEFLQKQADSEFPIHAIAAREMLKQITL
jgi:hypothetical protein